MLSITTLDSTTHDLILSCLPVLDIIALAKTNKELHALVSSYRRRAYNIHNLLRPYFNDHSKPHLVDQFRLMQSQTGTIISGSTALQFFARTCYPDSDLDLYTGVEGATDVARFLAYAGYIYTPREKQHVQWKVQLTEAARRAKPQDWRSRVYHWNGMVDLFDFRKGAKKIQLIVARESVVDLVLKFHSTVVMNIITHANAFSLYPRATFIENRSIACRETTPPESHKAALSKYEARGWKVVKILPRQELYYVMGVSDRRVFPKRSYSRRSSPNPRTTPHEVNWPVRVIGDDLTWSVSLPPISGQVQGPRLGEMLYSNSWRMRVERMDRIVDMVFEVKHSPWLKYPICKAACSETNDIWRAYEKYYKSVNGRGGPWDQEMSRGFYEMFSSGNEVDGEIDLPFPSYGDVIEDLERELEYEAEKEKEDEEQAEEELYFDGYEDSDDSDDDSESEEDSESDHSDADSSMVIEE